MTHDSNSISAGTLANPMLTEGITKTSDTLDATQKTSNDLTSLSCSPLSSCATSSSSSSPINSHTPQPNHGSQGSSDTNNAAKTSEADGANEDNPTIANRMRKFLPVVVDVETAGFNAATDALLEIACIPILMDDKGKFYAGEALNAHIDPFEGANLEQRALDFTGIDPNNPMRKAIAEEEKSALRRIFKALKAVRKEQGCRQCILVGHNAHFDLAFLNAAIERTNSKNHSPFHKFSVLDTVSFSALAFGQTVLARACKAAAIEFNGSDAHSALYDTKKTAELFCFVFNNYPMLKPTLQEDQTNVGF